MKLIDMEQPTTTSQNATLHDVGTFVNSFSHSLDSKKRLTIPAEWRNAAEVSVFYVKKSSIGRYLLVFPIREMQKRVTKTEELIANLPPAEQNEIRRKVYAQSCRVELDTQGRIRITDKLLEEAGIKENVELQAAGRFFEIWSTEVWNERTETPIQATSTTNISAAFDC